MTAMRTLLLQLPLSLPGPQAVYAQAWAESTAPGRLSVRHAPLALLPTVGAQTPVVAIVPAAALSWHRVSLPPGLKNASPRLQSALHGLLEEHLLQEPAQLHIALAPQAQAGQTVWVAVCDKAWLQQHLQALQAAQLSVQRLVPEFTPPGSGELLHALGDADSGWLWLRSAQHGVQAWPVAASAQLPAPWLEAAEVLAEPGLAAWAQSRWGERSRLVDSAHHWASALASGWELAQFELAGQLRPSRWWRWRERLDALWRQPRWRPARWGLLALLLAQLVGLNAWAWMTRQHWQAQQEGWTRMLQESFAHVTVVVDAPLQMARELAHLRQASGQLGPADFEAQLQALGAALPAGVAGPSRIAYEDGVLQWPALSLSPQQTAALGQALAARGYQLHSEGRQWRLSPGGQP